MVNREIYPGWWVLFLSSHVGCYSLFLPWWVIPCSPHGGYSLFSSWWVIPLFSWWVIPLFFTRGLFLSSSPVGYSLLSPRGLFRTFNTRGYSVHSTPVGYSLLLPCLMWVIPACSPCVLFPFHCWWRTSAGHNGAHTVQCYREARTGPPNPS